MKGVETTVGMDSRLIAAGVFLFIFGVVIIGVGYSLETGITPVQRSFNTDLANQFYGGIAALAIGGFLAAFGIGLTIYGWMGGGVILPVAPIRPQVPPQAPQATQGQAALEGFCIRCGAPRLKDAVFCPSCGNKL